MKDMTREEYCLYVNMREGSSLWEILADFTQSENEDVWVSCIPEFSRLILKWQRLGFLKIAQSVKWPAVTYGDEVSGEKLDALIRDFRSWGYAEEPELYVEVTLGARNISELDE
ncbi:MULTISPECIES: hypothetical protein [unclassified Streptomyces]|uniref:hypothetical protein n=1 Tax=unclassified Streptomyces TaxID=2593676 RepID=UPI0036FDB34A